MRLCSIHYKFFLIYFYFTVTMNLDSENPMLLISKRYMFALTCSEINDFFTRLRRRLTNRSCATLYVNLTIPPPPAENERHGQRTYTAACPDPLAALLGELAASVALVSRNPLRTRSMCIIDLRPCTRGPRSQVLRRSNDNNNSNDHAGLRTRPFFLHS